MKCPTCDTTVDSQMTFCPNCGTRLAPGSTGPANETPAPSSAGAKTIMMPDPPPGVDDPTEQRQDIGPGSSQPTTAGLPGGYSGPQPYTPQPYTPTQTLGMPSTSTAAIVSLICGILAWIFLPLICAIAAVVAGHMARREIQASNGQVGGSGMATAGLVLGYVQLALLVLLCIVIGLVVFLGLAFGAAS